MYKIKDVVYADAFKYLKYKGRYAFQFKDEEGIEEFDLNIDDMIRIDCVAWFNDKSFAQIVGNRYTYADYKLRIINMRYSNDDQIAIMLNKDDSSEDLFRFNKMQEWRRFASDLAHKLIEIS